MHIESNRGRSSRTFAGHRNSKTDNANRAQQGARDAITQPTSNQPATTQTGGGCSFYIGLSFRYSLGERLNFSRKRLEK